jgi:hypothetical protein
MSDLTNCNKPGRADRRSLSDFGSKSVWVRLQDAQDFRDGVRVLMGAVIGWDDVLSRSALHVRAPIRYRAVT